MCGPSPQQQSEANSEEQFTNTLQASYAANLADQQAALSHINSILEPVLAAGPNQTGFSPAEDAALNSQAIDSTAAAATNAQRQVANETAGRNDSGNLPESGVDQALKQRASSAAESQLASEQLGITESNYATGRANFQNAESGELGIAEQYNPVPTAGAANNASTSAFGEATQIAQEQSQEQADIAGGVTSLATGALGGFGNLDTTGGSTGLEQVQNFFAGF